jgi:hypothetical protein
VGSGTLKQKIKNNVYKVTNNMMRTTRLPAELESRIQHLENPENQGTGFSTTDWLYLWGLGLVVPALLLIWGWF